MKINPRGNLSTLNNRLFTNIIDLFMGKEGKEFLSLLFRVILPLLIQNALIQSVSLIDQVMVASLGTEAVASVGASNSLFSLYNSFLYGICSGCSFFLAQYWGKQDIPHLQHILGLTLSITVIMGTIFTAGVLCFPHELLQLFHAEADVMELGVQYMTLMVFSYLILSVTYPLNFCFRNIGKAHVSMAVTCLSMIVKVVTNYLFIFGAWGFPCMGIQGAALGTVFTRLFELIFYGSYTLFSGNNVFRGVGNFLHFNINTLKAFTVKVIPLIINEIMWSLGTTIYFIVYGYSGTVALAAMSIMQTLRLLMKTVISGFCNSASVIVGYEIGKGDIQRVGRFCKRLHYLSYLIGALSAIVTFLCIKPILHIYSIANTPEGDIVSKCMVILSIHVFITAVNSVNVEGIFRAGGDTSFVSLMDMGSVWLVGMPYTIITGIFLKWDIVIVYLAYIIFEIYKLPLGYYRYRSGKWLHKVGDEKEAVAD